MFHRKIDTIQRDLDSILDLFDEEISAYEDLGVKILKAQDGELSKRGTIKMQRQLSHDKKALHYYINFQFLTVMLHEHLDRNRLSKMMDSIKDFIFSGSA